VNTASPSALRAPFRILHQQERQHVRHPFAYRPAPFPRFDHHRHGRRGALRGGGPDVDHKSVPARHRDAGFGRARRVARRGRQPSIIAAADVAAEPAGDTSIRPFKFHATDQQLADLKRRIKATKWPDGETVGDDTQGVKLATIHKLADYWANHHDWRRAEAKIFSYPNFITTIDGLDIHFIHVKSKHPNALPVIITHGWPGSIIEQLKIIGPLTDPTAYGGKAEDAFDVVIPSLPGCGFSGKPTAPGWMWSISRAPGRADEAARLYALRRPRAAIGAMPSPR